MAEEATEKDADKDPLGEEGNSCERIKRRAPRVVTTPLRPKRADKPSFRDINEDDDGYHPYCDGPDTGCSFEADPWR